MASHPGLGSSKVIYVLPGLDTTSSMNPNLGLPANDFELSIHDCFRILDNNKRNESKPNSKYWSKVFTNFLEYFVGKDIQ